MFGVSIFHFSSDNLLVVLVLDKHGGSFLNKNLDGIGGVLDIFVQNGIICYAWRVHQKVLKSLDGN